MAVCTVFVGCLCVARRRMYAQLVLLGSWLGLRLAICWPQVGLKQLRTEKSTRLGR